MVELGARGPLLSFLAPPEFSWKLPECFSASWRSMRQGGIYGSPLPFNSVSPTLLGAPTGLEPCPRWLPVSMPCI